MQGSAGCTGIDGALSSRQDREGRGMQARKAGWRGQCRAGQFRAVQGGHVNLARQGSVDWAEEFRVSMPSRQCCAGSQGRAGRQAKHGR